MEIEKILIREMNKAMKRDEVPVAAVIVYKEKILSFAHNEVEGKSDVTGHAEILAIKKAAKKLGTWKLNGCKMYVSLEPCDMCKEVITNSRIDNVCYYVNRNEKNKNTTIFTKIDQDVNKEEFVNKIKVFFNKIRMSKK